MRVLKTKFNGIDVYMADPNGKAVMSLAAFERYVKALDEIAYFEQEVDRQYETQSPSSAPSTR